MKKILASSLMWLVMQQVGIQGNPTREVMIIEVGWGGGFFAAFLSTLNNARWCVKKNIIPVMAWGRNSMFYQEGGYNGSTEPWEYYFEPISEIAVTDAQNIPGVRRWGGYNNPDNEGPGSTWCHSSDYWIHLDQSHRREFKSFITNYVRIKECILVKVENFYKKYMQNKNIIGIHLRGTDKKIEAIPVSIESICQAANDFASKLPNCQFFIATDEQSLLDKATELLNGPVISYDSYRSINGSPVHFSSGENYSKGKIGEECLIEAILLSRCSKFVHTRSNMSSAVLILNPELENRVLTDEINCPLPQKPKILQRTPPQSHVISLAQPRQTNWLQNVTIKNKAARKKKMGFFPF